MPDVTLVLGVGGSGWGVKYNVFSTDEAQVWNGTAMVPDSAPARALGLITMVEGVAGSFSAPFPVALTTPGPYLLVAWRTDLGGPPYVRLTYPGSINYYFIPIDGTVDEPALVFLWNCNCCGSDLSQSRQYTAGSGELWEFRQLAPTDDLTGREYEVRVGLPTPVTWSMPAKVFYDSASRSIFADPDTADTTGQTGLVTVELWEIGTGISLPRMAFRGLVDLVAPAA